LKQDRNENQNLIRTYLTQNYALITILLYLSQQGRLTYSFLL